MKEGVQGQRWHLSKVDGRIQLPAVVFTSAEIAEIPRPKVPESEPSDVRGRYSVRSRSAPSAWGILRAFYIHTLPF